MQAGRLRHRITLQSLVPNSRGAAGGQIKAWTDFVTAIPAEVASVSGREFFASTQIQTQVSTKITIRYRDGVDATMRVIHITRNGPVYYAIEAPLPDAKKRFLTLMCTLRNAEGLRTDGS